MHHNFIASQFCHGLHLLLFRWQSPSISSSVFLPFFCQVRGIISRVFLPTYSLSRLLTYPNHLSLAFLLLTVVVSILSLSLVLSFLTWSLNVWPHVYLHIFIYVTSSLFTWELVIGTVSIPYSIVGWTIIWWIFPFTCDGTLLSHRQTYFFQLFHPHFVLLFTSVGPIHITIAA